MAKQYRMRAVMDAVERWDRSEWFTAAELHDLATECISQPRGGITTQGVSRMLTILEARGMIAAERRHDGKRYTRIEGAL